jgi:hypothetical protein
MPDCNGTYNFLLLLMHDPSKRMKKIISFCLYFFPFISLAPSLLVFIIYPTFIPFHFSPPFLLPILYIIQHSPHSSSSVPLSLSYLHLLPFFLLYYFSFICILYCHSSPHIIGMVEDSLHFPHILETAC